MENALFHERRHREKGQGYPNQYPSNIEQADVYSDQIADKTFKKTTTDWKQGTLGSAIGYLQDAYNKDKVSRDDINVVLDKINNSIAKYGYQLGIDPTSMQDLKIYFIDNNKKKKDGKSQ